ncbi:MAG: anti-anti-sigma factor [Actinomycetia bacterium]|nr:anti-anti-sigma factor [Actinomycetes bacterium]
MDVSGAERSARSWGSPVGNDHVRVEVTHGDRSSTVVVHGEVDVASAGVLEAAIDAVRDGRCREVVVDLGGVSFIDLAGLRVLHLAATDGLGVVVRNPSRLARRVIGLAGMADALPIEGDHEVG